MLCFDVQNGFSLLFQGDLGAIDDKYDVAISTACGPLDNIVCDTIETAQKCVNFLKRNNIGSATFIALDKVCEETRLINCIYKNICQTCKSLFL